MDIEPTLSQRFVLYVRNYLMDINVDPKPLFESCDINYLSSDETVIGVPLYKITDLIEKASIQCNDPYIGFHIAKRLHYESAGIIILTMLAAANVEEGIKTLCNYDQYYDSAIEVSLDIKANNSSFILELINPRNCKVHQLTELLTTLFVDMLNKGTRMDMPVLEVCFKHHTDKEHAPLTEFFGGPISYGQSENKVVFKTSFLKESFYTSNETLFNILTYSIKSYLNTFEKEGRLVGIVYREIIRQTTDSPPTINQVASNMGMSERTLRRHLSNEGISFQEAKNIARKKQAKYHLANSNMSLTQIALELGFSELSAFSRAFRKWSGETPQTYRSKLKKL